MTRHRNSLAVLALAVSSIFAGFLWYQAKLVSDYHTRQEQILEMAPLVIIICSNDGQIRFVNQRFHEYFGYTPRELQDHGLALIVPAELWEQHRDSFAVASEKAHHGELTGGTRRYQRIFPVNCKDGTLMRCAITVSAIGNGREIEFYAFLQPLPAEHEDWTRELPASRFKGL
jgi:PAS domain S-box-containing protein